MKCMICGEEETLVAVPEFVDKARLYRKQATGTIHLTGIEVQRCGCGDLPVYPHMSGLMALMKANPEVRHFHWSKEKKVWSL